jgi:anti-anti-sigma factor
MSELATVRCEQDGSRLVAHLAGEIDISNAGEVGTAIERAVPADAGAVIVDLSHVGYLDSSGISLLLRLSERLRARRIDLRLAVPRDAPVRAILELTGLGRMMTPNGD